MSLTALPENLAQMTLQTNSQSKEVQGQMSSILYLKILQTNPWRFRSENLRTMKESTEKRQLP